MSGSVSKLYSAELNGINANIVEVEADINVGLHSFNIVGLADKSISEAKERVNSALKNTGIKPPTKENRRITINLAPADTKKSGSHLDLPIALAYLITTDQIATFKTSDKLFVGELSLNGKIRGVSGCLNIVLCAKRFGIQTVFVPKENIKEASIVSSVNVIPVSSLREVMDHLEEKLVIEKSKPTTIFTSKQDYPIMMSDIKGNESAKRALLIAAAGGHNVLLFGPPGTGKTMLAQSLPSILPPLSNTEIIEVTRIYSALGLTKQNPFITIRPFRSPHHSTSFIALMGGGSDPRPGEVSLAHRGVLFLDEMPEFRRDALEGLRQPIESGVIHVSRAKKAVIFPARFMLVGAMNPCPCGYFEDPQKECVCSAHEILRYRKKISGPLLDRFDIQLEIPRTSLEELRKKTIANVEENKKIIDKVIIARNIQTKRFKDNFQIKTNAEMSSKITEQMAQIDSEGELFLKQAIEKDFISPRGYYRLLKIARTIADIENSENIQAEHLAEAFQYRIRVNS